ncbi:hypothetical protein VTO73DRAFT_11693 [Trametes versicolor]
MSSSLSAIIAELVASYQSARTFNSITVAVATLLAYDLLLCIGKEVQYAWRSPEAARSVPRVLYIFNRYMPVLWSILNLRLMGTLSDTRQAHAFAAVMPALNSDTVPLRSCTALQRLISVLNVLAMLGPASFTTMRVYALSGRNKILTSLVLLLSMGPFVVNVSTLYQDVPVNLPPPDSGCTFSLATTQTGFIACKSRDDARNTINH